MLRDTSDSNGSQGNADISVVHNRSASVLFGFIDRNIAGFRHYYILNGDSIHENRISDFLVTYFTECRSEKEDGFPPYYFVKNPTQSGSLQEIDIGVRVVPSANSMLTITEFEAKRLSDSSANKEYVCGTRGGMERIKRGQHSAHLETCGMFGYVQSKTSDKWVEKINGWIQDCADNSIDDSIDWTSPEEKLVPEAMPDIDKWSSSNARKGYSDIKLYHYFINLC